MRPRDSRRSETASRKGERSDKGLAARLGAHGIRPRRSLGQHFLSDPRLLESMVDAAGFGERDAVFEVGTGPGTLTRKLAERARRVLTVEVDRRLAAFARRELADLDNVEILEADALAGKSRLEPSVASRLEELGAFFWVSNLPYAVATPLIVVVLESGLPWRRAVLTLQRELAQKLTAQAGDAEFGAVTARVRFWSAVRPLRVIPRGAFWPAPAVASQVVALEPRAPAPDAGLYPPYRAWVDILFRSRRKQIFGILKNHLGVERAAQALRATDSSPRTRPQELSDTALLTLAKNFPVRR